MRIKRRNITHNPELITGILAIISFFIFSFFIHFGRFVSIDLKITLFLQSFFPRFFDTPFSLFSLIGSLEFASIILFILWAIYKKMNYIFVLALFGIMHMIELFSKAFVPHFPPPFKFFRYDLGLEFPSSYVRPGYSYPSGHASRTAFLSALILVMIWNNKKLSQKQKFTFAFCILAFDLIMFVSRIYLGEHWTSDVIGGILIGTSFGLISSYFLFSKKKS